jgi:hypothetical protein
MSKSATMLLCLRPFIVGTNEVMFALIGVCFTSNVLYLLGAKPRLKK